MVTRFAATITDDEIAHIGYEPTDTSYELIHTSFVAPHHANYIYSVIASSTACCHPERSEGSQKHEFAK